MDNVGKGWRMENVKVVKGVGPQHPKLIFVGEAPGEHEVIQGTPFVGTDGQILDGILRTCGINRDECYLTNVVKVRAPQSKIKNLPQLGYQIVDFYPSLYEELRGIDCQYCIPLGDVALNAIVGKDSISKHRGSIYPSPFVEGLTCIPTLHPGFVRELWSARGVVIADIKKMLRVMKGGREDTTFNTTLYPSLSLCESYIDSLLTLPKFAFDIEVVGSGQIACVGVGGTFQEGRSSLCIPFKKGFTNYWEELEERTVWLLLQRLFSSPLLKIGQFMSYDLTMLRPFIGEASPPWFDCNVAHHLLDPELPHTLAFMTSVYTDVPYYKDDPKDKGESWKYMSSSEQLWVYNGKDVEIPLILEEKMSKELNEIGMLDFMRGYQMGLLRALTKVSWRGMTRDEGVRGKLLEEKLEKVKVSQERLDALVGHQINVKSPKQMMTFVYDELHLPKQFHRKTRKLTLDEDAINKLSARYPNPLFELALELRGLYKEIGTYLNAVASDDGKVRGKYNPTGTETGRSSCSKWLDGTGLDFQNVPEDLRVMFIPSREGMVFVMVDLWQAEAYAVSVFSQCFPYLERLRRGVKIYKLVASWITGKDESEVDSVNKPGGEYYLAKRTTHAANYGLGPNLFSTLIKQPLPIAKSILEKYHTYATEIRAWHKEIQSELERTRTLTNPFGRRRVFRQRFGEEMFREAYAGLPQGTIADVLHQAQVKMEWMLTTLRDAYIVHEGFDSLMIECWKDDLGKVKGMLDIAFDKILFWKGTEFKIPYEMKVGERWK